MPVARQCMIIWCGSNGYLDDVPTEKVLPFEAAFLKFCDEKFPDIEIVLTKENKIDDATEAKLKDAVEKFKEQFKA
jgi:F-type H+-transporting ATPase subunit alpha